MGYRPVYRLRIDFEMCAEVLETLTFENVDSTWYTMINYVYEKLNEKRMPCTAS